MEEEEEEEIILSDQKKRKMMKNPTVETQFLPDKERDEREKKEREELAKLWKEEQENIKNEDMEIDFIHWDGNGEQHQVLVKKGWAISKFLEKARTDVKELRGHTSDALMLVKEDYIVPQHLTFYELMLLKYKNDDKRVFKINYKVEKEVNKSSSKQEDKRLWRIVERRWYDRNKHVYPANHWELFDPSRKDKYTVG